MSEPVQASRFLRQRENCRELRPGSDDPIVRLKGCPDCYGYGWFVANPFAEYNKRFYQCPTCIEAKRHFDKTGELPGDIAAALDRFTIQLAAGEERG